MAVFIPDVSEFQSNVNAPALIGGGYHAIIVRVAYGTRTDRLVAAGRVGYMRAAGFSLIGWYLFLRASQPLADQMALVKQLLGNLRANEFLVIDWERDLDGSLPPVAMRDQALADLTAWGGKPCVLYGPASLLRQYPAPRTDPQWPASYETPDPSLTGEVMWQYTDGQYTSGGYRPVNFPGIGLCDATVYYGDWDQLAARLAVPAPAPTPTPVGVAHVVGAAATSDAKGYWIADALGHVYRHGDAADHGQVNVALAQPVVGIAADPATTGFWLAAADGGVFAFGAAYDGGVAGVKLAKPVVGIAAHPDGGGYWLAAADGGVFAFGDAPMKGGLGAVRLAAPVVGIAATPSGNGYWMAASDGGVFAFGDAAMKGSLSGVKLAGPVVAIAATPSGGGYWLVGSDGGVFNFGDARMYGSMGGKTLAAAVVGAMRAPDGNGYAEVAADGGIFTFGDFAFSGAGA